MTNKHATQLQKVIAQLLTSDCTQDDLCLLLALSRHPQLAPIFPSYPALRS